MSAFDQYNFKGQKALVRVDFNVPLHKETFAVTDDTRIKSAVPTIQKILNDGGSAILMSHFGRPKNGPEKKYSLQHIVPTLQKYFPSTTIVVAEDCIGAAVEAKAKNLQPNEILLLENLRFHKEEEAGDKAFAADLARLGDVWVNDAFGTAHRAHASTAVMGEFFPKEKRLFGKLMEAEVASAEKVLHNAQAPFTAIIGGAKVSDKILIIENLLKKANNIIIGGGMAYTFWKALGKNIGNSLCETEKLDLALDILSKAKAKAANVQILLPIDSIIADQFAENAQTKNCTSGEIPEGWMGLDIGFEARKDFAECILNSKTILWNGPMGVFEMPAFQMGTKAVAEAVAAATSKGAFSLVGGGDSVAAVNQFNFNDKVSYVSTGGGAMLEFFEGKTLPGIKAVKN